MQAPNSTNVYQNCNISEQVYNTKVGKIPDNVVST